YISIDNKQFYKIDDEIKFSGDRNTVFIEKVMNFRTTIQGQKQFLSTYTIGQYHHDIQASSFDKYLNEIELNTLNKIDRFDDLVDYMHIQNVENNYELRKKYVSYYSPYDYKNDGIIDHKIYKEFKQKLENQLNQISTPINKENNRIDNPDYKGYLVFSDYDYHDIHLSSYEVYTKYYKIVLRIYHLMAIKCEQYYYKELHLGNVQNYDLDEKIIDATKRIAFHYGSHLKMNFILRKWEDLIKVSIPDKLNTDLTYYLNGVYRHIETELKTKQYKQKDIELTSEILNHVFVQDNDEARFQNKMACYIVDNIAQATKINDRQGFGNDDENVRLVDKKIMMAFSEIDYSYDRYGYLTDERKAIMNGVKLAYMVDVIEGFKEELLDAFDEDKTYMIMGQLARISYLVYLYRYSNQSLPLDNYQTYMDKKKEIAMHMSQYDKFVKYVSDIVNELHYNNHDLIINKKFYWYYSTFINDLKLIKNQCHNQLVDEYDTLLDEYFHPIIQEIESITNENIMKNYKYHDMKKLNVKSKSGIKDYYLNELSKHQYVNESKRFIKDVSKILIKCEREDI
ncbi:MAG: hypothetical protein LUH02_12410, partial [Erysipelotrichaceae bacterium]|nr:hypothetical protein [Erysipelotrichaceae bacterium]